MRWPLMRILCSNFFPSNHFLGWWRGRGCKQHRQKKKTNKNKYKPTISIFVNISPVGLCVLENNITKDRFVLFNFEMRSLSVLL